jgi:hypothetical protein
MEESSLIKYEKMTLVTFWAIFRGDRAILHSQALQVQALQVLEQNFVSITGLGSLH